MPAAKHCGRPRRPDGPAGQAGRSKNHPVHPFVPNRRRSPSAAIRFRPGSSPCCARRWIRKDDAGHGRQRRCRGWRPLPHAASPSLTRRPIAGTSARPIMARSRLRRHKGNHRPLPWRKWCPAPRRWRAPPCARPQRHRRAIGRSPASPLLRTTASIVGTPHGRAATCPIGRPRQNNEAL